VTDEPRQLVEPAVQDEVARPCLEVVGAAARTRLSQPARGDPGVEGRADVVVVEVEVERHRAEHAHDLAGAPDAAPPARLDLEGLGGRRLRRLRRGRRGQGAAHVLGRDDGAGLHQREPRPRPNLFPARLF
jgi:hypothetical protein